MAGPRGGGGALAWAVRLARGCLAAAAGAYVLAWIGVFLLRWRYPFELEWMEGGWWAPWRGCSRAPGSAFRGLPRAPRHLAGGSGPRSEGGMRASMAS